MVVFSGFGSPATGPMRVLYNEDLVKQDLLNHFNTRKGERVMDTDYGFIGWDLMFELKNPRIREAIEQDARRIVKTDPRVIEKEIVVVEEEHGFFVFIDLYFQVLDTTDRLSMFFDANNIADQV